MGKISDRPQFEAKGSDQSRGSGRTLELPSQPCASALEVGLLGTVGLGGLSGLGWVVRWLIQPKKNKVQFLAKKRGCKWERSVFFLVFFVEKGLFKKVGLFSLL